jgi:hypothetical protein
MPQTYHLKYSHVQAFSYQLIYKNKSPSLSPKSRFQITIALKQRYELWSDNAVFDL